jgi:hypothetical protein
MKKESANWSYPKIFQAAIERSNDADY